MTGVSRRTRALVWAFLAAFFICGFARIEAWPLTGWRLFSVARERLQTSYEVVLVNDRGEHTMPFSRMGLEYRGATQIASELARTGRPEAVCSAWAAGARRAGKTLEEIRIYRVVRDVGDRRGDRGAPPRDREQVVSCLV